LTAWGGWGEGGYEGKKLVWIDGATGSSDAGVMAVKDGQLGITAIEPEVAFSIAGGEFWRETNEAAATARSLVEVGGRLPRRAARSPRWTIRYGWVKAPGSRSNRTEAPLRLEREPLSGVATRSRTGRGFSGMGGKEVRGWGEAIG